MASRTQRSLATVGLVALALVGASCSGDGPQDNPPDCDYFVQAGLTSPVPPACGGALSPYVDQECLQDHFVCMTVRVDVLAQGPVPPPGVLDRFRMTSYVVEYVNVQTGRSVPGVDVPRPLPINVPFISEDVPVEFFLTGWPVLVTAQQAEPPLSTPSFYPASGGGVDLDAIVTFFGHPDGDPSQDCSGTFTYRFNIRQNNCL